MGKFYEISFWTKKGSEQKWKIHVEAKNAKEAKEAAALTWENDNRLNGMHRFAINIRVLKDNEEFKWHYFTKIKET